MNKTEENDLHADACGCLPVDPAPHIDNAEDAPRSDELYLIADFFRVFGDPTRLSILLALDAGEMCVCDIAEAVGMSKSAVSHHLSSLRAARLVTFRREGKHIHYRLADNHVRHIIECAVDHIREKQ